MASPKALSMTHAPRINHIRPEVRTELIRKSLHVSIGFVPGIASVAGVSVAMGFLIAGILTYLWAEVARTSGKSIPIISKITVMAMRDRDMGHFVPGPVTLAMGALLALTLYPAPAAAAGIYALAFGDGLASLAGKAFGRIKIPFTGGKSLEGSLACFVAVSFSIMTFIPGIPFHHIMIIAAGATFIEALPLGDLDNLAIPTLTGLIALILF